MNSFSILILEDEPAHVEAIRRAFEFAGLPAEIRTASSLREYCELADARPPDIAIMDLNLPDGNPQESLSLLSEDLPFPVLIMTSLGSEAVAVTAMKAGALDYLVKSPETFADMPRSVQRALREWGVRQARKRAEAALLEAEKRAEEQTALLKLILESPQGVVIFSLDRGYRYTEFTNAHRETMKMIWGAEIALGMSMLDVITNPDDRERAKGYFDRTLQGENLLVEEEYGEQSLHRTFYENRYSPLRDDAGKIFGLTVFVTEITKRKLAQQEVLKLRAAVEQSANTIDITDPKGVIEYVNPAFQKNTG